MTPADIDRRKALIVACLYPTRVRREFRTEADCKRLAAILGISRRTLTAWESGDILPPDKHVTAVERWLAAGPVWRYDKVDHLVGPEAWPKPLDMACVLPSKKPLACGNRRLKLP